MLITFLQVGESFCIYIYKLSKILSNFTLISWSCVPIEFQLNMNEPVYHIPALLPQTIEGLDIKADGIYVDVTLGGGGHSRAIVEKLSGEGHLYSMDQDIEAVERAFSDPRFTVIHGNFRYITNFLRYHGVEKVDGIMADLGVSFHHFDDPERGFSFRWDGRLDMRMNRKARIDATRVLADYSREQLADMFYLLGELKNARKMADAIVAKRLVEPVETVEQLVATIKPFINPRQEKKELAQVFQALRIEVNRELDVLKSFLTQTLNLLKPGGRLAVITYHSLEDRLVKNFMKTGSLDGHQEKDFYGRSLSPLKLITNKPVTASEAEVEANPRSRSAKLRVAEKI